MTAKKPKHIKTPFFTLPAVVQIGAFPIRIEDAKLDSDDMGLFDSGALLIQVDVAKHTSYAQLMVTLLHEVGHAIDYVFNTKRSDADVDRHAHGYTQAFLYIAEAQE